MPLDILTREEKEKVVQDFWYTETTVKEIGDMIGVSPVTVGAIAARLGLPPRVNFFPERKSMIGTWPRKMHKFENVSKEELDREISRGISKRVYIKIKSCI